MFDFFKELYLEASGIDMEQIEKESREKLEKEKNNTIILKPKSKKYLLFMGLIFVVIHIFGIVLAVAAHDAASVVKSSIMIGLAVSAMICIPVKSRICEIIGIALCVLVILLSLSISYI